MWRRLARHCLRCACTEMSRRPSSRDVCLMATPVDNAYDCLPTPQTAHGCSEHECIVCIVGLTYLQNSYSTWTGLRVGAVNNCDRLFVYTIDDSWLLGLSRARVRIVIFIKMLAWCMLSSCLYLSVTRQCCINRPNAARLPMDCSFVVGRVPSTWS